MAQGGFDSVMGALNTTMNLRLLNQNVISGNIANADTPGYKAKAVEFEHALRDALGTERQITPSADRPGHRVHSADDSVTPEIYDDPNGVESLDGNTVNRADEMAKMAENELLYNAAQDMFNRKLGMLKYTITEGGGSR